MSRPGKYVATGEYVATGNMSRLSSMSRPMSRQVVCRDQCHDQKALSRSESFVATNKAEKLKKKPKIDILT